MNQQQFYSVERTLEFTLKQRFVVAADNFEQAAEKAEEFVNSDWTDETAQRIGVVQVGDEMEQHDNSQEILASTHGEGPVDPEGIVVDESMRSVLLQNRAEDMFAMLKALAGTPQTSLAGIADAGLKLKALVGSIEAGLGRPNAALQALVAGAKGES